MEELTGNAGGWTQKEEITKKVHYTIYMQHI